ncbi:MAG: hypothetical protein P4L83_13235 [Nevskia sp.]|nr:hypothetical protein [Nevskia sp.]
MRQGIGGWYRFACFPAAVVAVFAALAAPGQAAASGSTTGQAPAPLIKQTFCNWTFANTGSAPADGATRTTIMDINAGYWELYISSGFAAGTRFKIEGEYPATRYFSLQVTTDATRSLQTIAELPDFAIVPDVGSQSPYPAINSVDPSIASGGHYTAYLVFSAKPANPEPNTLYVDPAKISGFGGTISLTYRTYGDFAGVTIAQHGGVPLPDVSMDTSKGYVPMNELFTPWLCAPLIAFLDAFVVTPVAAITTALMLPMHPGPIPALPVPPAPVFQLRNPDSTTDLAVNRDARYVYTDSLSQMLGDLVVVRMRAPTFSTQPGGGSDPQLRYWSYCEGGNVNTIACMKDFDATIDSDGFFNLVLSIPGKRPPNADAKHGFNWMTFGPEQPGVLIYRQLQPSPNFTQSAFDVPENGTLEATMGDYLPVATYCSNAVFAAHTIAGDSAAKVFAGCQVGR